MRKSKEKEKEKRGITTNKEQIRVQRHTEDWGGSVHSYEIIQRLIEL